MPSCAAVRRAHAEGRGRAGARLAPGRARAAGGRRLPGARRAVLRPRRPNWTSSSGFWTTSSPAASGQLVTITAEPGVGKTRLAAEFAAIAAGRSAPGRHRPVPALRRGHAAARAGRGPAADRRTRPGTCGALPDRADARRLRPRRLGLARSGLRRDGVPGELPGQLAWAATLVLETIGRRRPVLLVLDDLHAAKPVLLDVLRQVAAGSAGAAVLLLGLARPELLEKPPPGVAARDCWPWPAERATRRGSCWSPR